MPYSIFKDITLIWKGKEYVIPSDRVMGAIACAEQYVTLHELHQNAAGGTIKLTTLAAAYAGVLQYAGVKNVDVESVYGAMFEKNSGRDVILKAIEGLILMMVPPSAMNKVEDDEGGKGNRQTRRTAMRLSRKHTKRL